MLACEAKTPAVAARCLAGARSLVSTALAGKPAGLVELLREVLEQRKAQGLTSLAIHRAAGFRDVGRRERIAQLDGIWRDTILLERRA